MDNKEIELKFGFDGDANNLTRIFKSMGTVLNETTLHLDNTYFDTDAKDLFALRAGLRIRHADDFSEQTLKVKGENIGGLHKRIEYNLPIDRNEKIPNLLKFPKEAFPEDYDLETLQSQLHSVCRIKFTRRLFNLELLDSTFEVAYDNGYIEVDREHKYPLNELEIELKKTSVKSEEILNLFSILCTQLATCNLPLLLEPFSKMHRASLLQNQAQPNLDLASFDPSLNLVDYITGIVKYFETLYGYFLIRRDPVILSHICNILESLLISLKYLKHRDFLAFITGQNEPVEYKKDLQIIIRLLKSFYKVCKHSHKKMLLLRLKQKEKGLDDCFNRIRESEKQNKIFLIPLKLRLLLSMIEK